MSVDGPVAVAAQDGEGELSADARVEMLLAAMREADVRLIIFCDFLSRGCGVNQPTNDSLSQDPHFPDIIASGTAERVQSDIDALRERMRQLSSRNLARLDELRHRPDS
jgi:hypothetical protein